MNRKNEVTEFTTFDEMVSVLALNNPHALVLDWWRRLERAIDYYFNARGLRRPPAVEAEDAIAADPKLGPAVAAEIRQLRRTRNAVAHDEPQPIARDEAATYAAACLRLIWEVATDP
jgi:hypothetical protein